MNRLPINDPMVNFLYVYLRGRIDRARSEDTSRGASAVEWVVISAIVVAIVAFVGYTINKALSGKATDVGNCITKSDGSSNGC
ncbi:Flp family type IVb pilin [Actinacidiphila guanduensis]|jgi:Flp pilus assembly pilin Flp|uniref:Uncharacterized protein n=1 Tax=Actinacidiphila guanduensis TaxID=310781 RepID=A0A1H0F9Y2_9ACTN|nr:hypothetical protein [Actinacidiphila guanduensis]SDN91401.1 hypothetical protein SAMN05216259_106212 [Actinacidiphila guanduensis]